MKKSGRSLHLQSERDPDPRYRKPKGDCKQIAQQQLRRHLKREKECAELFEDGFGYGDELLHGRFGLCDYSKYTGLKA